jgi:hypothetical protein
MQRDLDVELKFEGFLSVKSVWKGLSKDHAYSLQTTKLTHYCTWKL